MIKKVICCFKSKQKTKNKKSNPKRKPNGTTAPCMHLSSIMIALMILVSCVQGIGGGNNYPHEELYTHDLISCNVGDKPSDMTCSEVGICYGDDGSGNTG